MRRPAYLFLVILLLLEGCSGSGTSYSTAIITVSDVVKQIESTTKKTMIVVLLVEKESKKKDIKSWMQQKSDWHNERGRVVYEARIKSAPYTLQLQSIGIERLSGTVNVEHRLLSMRAVSIDATYEGIESHTTSLVNNDAHEAIAASIDNGKGNKEVLVVVMNF